MKKDTSLLDVYGTINNKINPVKVTADEVVVAILTRMFNTATRYSYTTPEMLGDIFNLPDEFTARIKDLVKSAHLKRLLEVVNIDDLDNTNVIIATNIPEDEYKNWDFYAYTLINKSVITEIMDLPEEFEVRKNLLTTLLAINNQTPYKNCPAGDTTVWRGYAKGGVDYFSEITGIDEKETAKSLQFLEKNDYIVSIRPSDLYKCINKLPEKVWVHLWRVIPRHIIKRPEYTEKDIEEIEFWAKDNALYLMMKVISKYVEIVEKHSKE